MEPSVADQWFQIFQVAQALIMAAATVFVWLWGRDRRQQQEILEARFGSIDRRLQLVATQFEDANREASKLASRVQVLVDTVNRLPEELRAKFMSLDRADDLLAESRRDRAAIWDELRRWRDGPR